MAPASTPCTPKTDWTFRPVGWSRPMRVTERYNPSGSATSRPRPSCGRGCTPNRGAPASGRCCSTRWMRTTADFVRGDPKRSFPSRCPPRQATTHPASSHGVGRPTQPPTKTTTTCSTPTGASPSRLLSGRAGPGSRPIGRRQRTPINWPASPRRSSLPTIQRYVWGSSPQHPVPGLWQSWAGPTPPTTTTTPRSSPRSSATGSTGSAPESSRSGFPRCTSVSMHRLRARVRLSW